MATAVVSGRVSEDIKREVDRILERADKTPGDVIRDVWVTIYQTGELPTSPEQEEEFKHKQEVFRQYTQWLEAQEPAPDWLVNLTDAEMSDMIAEEQMRERGNV